MVLDGRHGQTASAQRHQRRVCWAGGMAKDFRGFQKVTYHFFGGPWSF
jgi:hypothetical protein